MVFPENELHTGTAELPLEQPEGCHELTRLQIGFRVGLLAVGLAGGAALVVTGLHGSSSPDSTYDGPIPTGPRVIESSNLPSSQSVIPTETLPVTSSPAAHHHSGSPTSTEIAPRIQLVAPAPPLKAVFIPLRGKRRTAEIDPTQLQTTTAHREVQQSIDPPLVYCPGTNPVGVEVPYTIGKTKADCQSIYYVKNFGDPHSDSDPQGAEQTTPTVIAAHTSVLGYWLSGNATEDTKGGDRLIITTADGKLTYRARAQHYFPKKGADDLAKIVYDEAPKTSVVDVTCDDNGGYNEVVIYDLVRARKV